MPADGVLADIAARMTKGKKGLPVTIASGSQSLLEVKKEDFTIPRT